MTHAAARRECGVKGFSREKLSKIGSSKPIFD